MPLVDLKAYLFERNVHWTACARDGFVVDGDRLTVGAERAEQTVSAAIEDRGVLALAYDPSGRLFWLRTSGELASFGDGHVDVEGSIAPGPLSSTDPPSVHLAVDRSFAWLACGDRLLTFERLHWQQLSERPIDRPIALIADQASAWCLVDAGPDPDAKASIPRWIHVGPSGSIDRPNVPCPKRKQPLAGAVDPCSGRLLTLYGDGVWRADPCDTLWSLAIDLRPHRCRFEPDRIAVDGHGIVHLFDRENGLLWSFAEDGARIAERDVRSDVNLIASSKAIALAGDAGIIQLIQPSGTATAAHGDEARQAVLLTPTLISPREHGATWHRLRLSADLPQGTALRIRLAPSDDDGLARRIADIAARTRRSATERLMAIEGLLPWDESLETSLAKADDPLGKGWFDVPLDGIEATYLWIALHLHVPPTSPAATVHALKIRYPARSWIDNLPAIYRADPVRAAPLRRLLAVFETVFDDLENRIDALPKRLDEESTDDHAWLDFLLRWIGLPLPSDLSIEQKRAFLIASPGLARRRGTPEALEDALRIVTGRAVRVTDRADEPMPWIVSGEEAVLGHGTLLIRRSQRGFALGGMARLGRDGLGRSSLSTTDDLVRRTRTLLIDIDAGAALDDATLAAIEALLDHFLPAACRHELRLGRARDQSRGRRLGRDARLVDDRGHEIGRRATLGHLALSGDPTPRLRLDHWAPLDGRHRLL